MLDLPRFIDHTLLKPEAAESDIRRLAAQAIRLRFAAVCVNGRWVALAADLLRQAGADHGPRAVAACAVVGFPLGAAKSSVKAHEAAAAVRDGAREIDMVVALDTLLTRNFDAARDDIAAVVQAARAVRPETLIKVILETAALNDEQTALGCRAAHDAGADFLKTSTGFHPAGGATEQAVCLLLRHGAGLAVKASGGIRDRAAAEKFIALGAVRIGTSAGAKIVGES
jgi:deoxyribose-phosphate aldolase